MRLPAAYLVVALLVLAGCMGGGKDDPVPTGPAPPSVTVTPQAALGVENALPPWFIGQTWTYAVELPGLPTTNFMMMVAEDQGDVWIVATDNRSQALHHGLYSTNPVLGRITKTGLGPFQSGEPVEMFQFPLTDRKTWTATFFGEAMTFEAVYDDVLLTLPGVYLPGFKIVAEGGSGQRAEYNFIDAVGWFTDFQYYAADGTKEIHLTLKAYGGLHAGPYHFLRGRDKVEETLTASTPPAEPLAFEIAAADGAHAVGLGLIAQGTGEQAALLNVTLRDAADAVVYSELFVLPKDEMLTRIVERPSQEGEWTIEVLLVGSATLEVRAAGLQVTQGQL